MSKYSLVLSRGAETDLDELYTFGFLTWDEERADHYYDGLLDHFETLKGNPFLYPAVDYVRDGYRRSLYRSHVIYYRVRDETIDIMAVVGKQDLDRHLEDQADSRRKRRLE